MRVKKASAQERSVEEIVERVYGAILEHRLAPGTKLGEDRLATIFRTSRARIREVLARDTRHRDVEDVEVLLADQVEQQVHRAFEGRAGRYRAFCS